MRELLDRPQVNQGKKTSCMSMTEHKRHEDSDYLNGTLTHNWRVLIEVMSRQLTGSAMYVQDSHTLYGFIRRVHFAQ